MAMNRHSWPVVKVCSEINHSVQVLKCCLIALARFSHFKFKTLNAKSKGDSLSHNYLVKRVSTTFSNINLLSSIAT